MEDKKSAAPLQYEEGKPRKRIRWDPRNLIIIIMGISLAALGINSARLEKALREDEEYISAEASRVFEYYGEKDVINLNDPTYGDTWLAALSDVPRHEMDFENVKLENGFKHYYIDGARVNKTGVDVSYHQRDIDWEAVKADGVDFAMIRLGYRGYESGQINIDERFHEYAEGALEAGLDIGVYFYSQAVTVEEAVEEAETVLREIEGYEIMYPVVFDWEIVGEETARTNDVSADVLNKCAAAFCNRIAQGGHIPMIYSVKKMALTKLDMSRLAGFDFWLAEYREIPEYPYYFTMWQYASDGRVNGIEGDVDLNMSLVDYSKVKR
ncbi:MAG: glycoside hydrolase family 25 protein [Oscillospiraceae bacterium]|nr:glycoside hydrolase family 25 protein [Oscillospiraceae bacterium]